MTDRQALTLIEEIPYPPQKVWRAFSSADMLAKWLMPSDFEPVIGREFRMQGTPVPAVDFDGVTIARLLEFDEAKRFKISWTDSKRSVDWTVTWSLEPMGGGTRLTMVHDGFDLSSPRQQMSHKVMGAGWVGMNRKIGRIIEELETA